LRETRGFVCKAGDSLNKLHLCGSSSRNKTSITGDGLNNVDTVINGALYVIKVILGGTSEDDSRGSCLVVLLSKDGYAVATDFESLDNVNRAHLFGHRGTETSKGCSTDHAA
jgi:hypothetical protein